MNLPNKLKNDEYKIVMKATGSRPLDDFLIETAGNGSVTRSMDEILHCLVIKIRSSITSNTCITIPKSRRSSLNITLPVANFYVRNIAEDFKIEIDVLDTQRELRKFKLSTFARDMKNTLSCARMPLQWTTDWNLVTLDLNDFSKRIYGSSFYLCKRITIHANCHLRQIFFTKGEYEESQLPSDLWIVNLRPHTKRRRNKSVPIPPSPELRSPTIQTKKIHPISLPNKMQKDESSSDSELSNNIVNQSPFVSAISTNAEDVHLQKGISNIALSKCFYPKQISCSEDKNPNLNTCLQVKKPIEKCVRFKEMEKSFGSLNLKKNNTADSDEDLENLTNGFEELALSPNTFKVNKHNSRMAQFRKLLNGI